MINLLPALLLAIAAPVGGPPLASVDDRYLETIKVADNIYVFKPKIDWTHGNGVAIIGSDGVFFIDTYIQFNYAEEAIRRLRKVTALPVRYVLNTHWHTDHVMGNSVFKRIFPHCQIIAQDSTAVMLDSVIKSQVEQALPRATANLAQTDSEVRAGKRSNGTPIVGTMKPFWEASLRDAREYLQHFRPERYVSPDITFGDSITMHWGAQTLKLIHMPQNGHAEGDVVVWIPEKRLLVTGDLVVAPTPYATHQNIPGMISGIRALIAMNPAIIIPGHGEVEYDLTYMRLLERAFTTYRAAAETAFRAKVPLQRAADSIAFPEIDRLFIGEDEMKRFSYRAFFSRNLIRQTYQHPPDSLAKSASKGGLPEDAANGQSVEQRLAEYMRARAALGQFSGGVLVARAGTVLLAGDYGYADLELAAPNTRTTRFAAASITKQFTAFAVAQLRDAGKLNFNDPVCRFLDGCPDAWAGITIDQLIHHSSGIPDYEEELELDSDRYAQFMIAKNNTTRILEDARRKPLDFPPGSKFHYSNTGYLLLGRIIERVSGERYADYMEKHIFTPLGMKSSGIVRGDRFTPFLATGYSTGDGASIADIAAGIDYLKGDFFRSTPVSIISDDHAEGGLYTTIDDLYAWDRALARGALVSKTTMQEIFAPQRGGYAFGWVIASRFGQPNESHTGVLPGFVSRIDRYPVSDVTVILLSNVNSSRFSQTSRDLAAIVLGQAYDVPKPRRLLARDSLAESRFVGTYTLPDGTPAHVRSGARFLEVAVPGQFTAGLVPENAATFYAPFFEGDVTFTADTSGHVSMNMHYAGIDHVARRAN